jgi:hypothetical protein
LSPFAARNSWSEVVLLDWALPQCRNQSGDKMVGLFFLKIAKNLARDLFYVFDIDGLIPGDIVHVDDPLCIKEEEHLPHCIDCFLVCEVWKETGDSFIVTILFRTSNKHH